MNPTNIEIDRIRRWVPADDRLAVTLGVVLFFGLGIVVPLLYGVVDALGIPLPLPQLLGVGGVGVLFGLLVVALGRIRLGLYVALIVTGTFAANIPLTKLVGSLGEYGSYPGMVAWVMLFHLPLGLLVGYKLLFGDRWVLPLSVEEKLLGAFVVWTAVTGFFTPGPRADVAVFYALFVLLGVAVFGTVRRGVEAGEISFESALGVFGVAVVGHTVVALLQMIRGASFGVQRLGEPPVRATIDLFLFNLFDFTVGGWVAGFTGHPFVLGGYILVSFPVVLSFTTLSIVNNRKRDLLALTLLTLLFTVVLRGIEGDAIRGGLFVSLLSLLGLLVLVRMRSPQDAQRASRARELVDTVRGGFTSMSVANLASILVITTVVVAIVVSPSTATVQGESTVSNPVDGSANVNITTTATPTATPSTATPTATPSTATPTATPSTGTPTATPPTPSTATPMSDPNESYVSGNTDGTFGSLERLVDLRTLDTRVNQTVMGIRLVMANPVAGIGGKNFQYVAPSLGLESKCFHNVYLGLLVETGIVGFALYSLAILSILRKGLWLLFEKSRVRVLSLGVLAGVLGFLATEAFYCSLMQNYNTMFMFYLVAGVTVGAYHARE